MTTVPTAGARVATPDADANDGLRVTDLTVRYGDAVAVNAVSLSVAPGEIVALLGANGAGKSSMLGAISGLIPAASGEVWADGRPLEQMEPDERAHHVAQVPEGRRLFPQHTVRENLMLGAFRVLSTERAKRLHEVEEVLPRLEPLMSRRADLLSGGEQQMVALGRGLMGKAPVLMIDELSLGLAPTVSQRFAETLLSLKEQGYAILLVEQYVTLALQVADRVVVLDHGTVVLEGTADAVRDEVMALEEAYLGGDEGLLEATDEGAVTFDEEFNPGRFLNLQFLALNAMVGLVILVASVFLPWFQAAGVSSGYNIEGYSVPWEWVWLPIGLTALAAGLVWTAWRQPEWRPLQVRYAITALGSVVTGLLFARIWLLGSGLTGGPNVTFGRDYGVFIAISFSAPGLLLAGVGSLVEYYRRRAFDRSRGPANDKPAVTESIAQSLPRSGTEPGGGDQP